MLQENMSSCQEACHKKTCPRVWYVFTCRNDTCLLKYDMPYLSKTKTHKPSHLKQTCACCGSDMTDDPQIAHIHVFHVFSDPMDMILALWQKTVVEETVALAKDSTTYLRES